MNKIPNPFDSKYNSFIQSCSKETVVRFINKYIANLDINSDNLEYNSKLSVFDSISKYKLFKWPEEYKDLSNLNLSDIWFMGIDLSGVNFSNSNLNYSQFTNCNLNSANLSHTKLLSASFINTDFSNADFTETDILLAENINNIYDNTKWTSACPESGSFIGYKIAYLEINNNDNRSFDNTCLIKLEIPEDAIRLTPYISIHNSDYKKCRCNKAKVLEITSIIDPDKHYDKAYSDYAPNFEYKVGEMVSVEDFDDDREKECSSGIHFFMTKENAYRYLVK